MKVLIITANDYEDLELHYPMYRFKEEGWDVTVAAPHMGKLTGKHGYTIQVDEVLSEVNPEEYDILLIPGGKAPEEVRLSQDALKIVKHFFRENKLVAAICHGMQVLISAGLASGRGGTCWKGVKDDFIAAGGNYSDSEVIVDGNLVTSRMPDDLPAFMKEITRLSLLLTKETRKRRVA